MPVPRPWPLLLLLAAGCAAPADDEASSSPSQLPVLEQFRECSFTYWDGTPVPCKNQAEPVSAAAETPVGWVCLGERGPTTEGHVRLYQNPLTSEYAIRYEMTPRKDTVSLILRTEGTASSMYNLTHGPLSGFVPVGRLESASKIGLRFYETSYESNSSQLQGGAIEQLWTEHEKSPWAVHQISARDQTYYFQQNIRFVVEGAAASSASYQMVPFVKSGRDFQLLVDYVHYFYLEFDLAENLLTC